MSSRRLVILAACLTLTFGLAASAQAKMFSVTAGGGQLHIGNGLALPIQQAATPGMTGTVFPPLLVPVNGAQFVGGTTANPLLTAMATPSGPITKQGYQRKINLGAGLLAKAGAQTTVGVKFSNPTVFAVGTNLNYSWPAQPAAFSQTALATAPTVVANFGGTMTYTNTLGSRFGGPASFALSAGGGASGLYAGNPVTVFIKVNATTPPCTHNAFGGANPGCVAGMILAAPTGSGGIGGASTMTVMTPGVVINPNPNVAIMKMGMTPLGTVLAAVLVANNPAIPTNMASSQPGPWTTGQVVISQPAASPPEVFTLSGKDSRTANGGGTIQFVSGAVSARVASGPNANRGWVSLTLAPISGAPSMSSYGLAATAGLILLLTIGYATRRRLFA